MSSFDIVVSGGLLADGTGRPGRLADVGVAGDRIVAVGDLSSLDAGEVAARIDAVVVNGVVVVLDGEETGARSGRLLRRS